MPRRKYLYSTGAMLRLHLNGTWKMHFTLCRCLSLLVLLGGTNLHAQFAPVTAKMRHTKEVIVDGKVVETQTKEGNFYRSSDGSTLKQWTKANGNLDWGDLWDNKNLMSYRLEYSNRQAYGDPAPKGAQAGRPDALFPLASKALPQDSVEGIRCAIFPVRLHIPGNPPIPVGRTCESIEYNLQLKEDVTTQPVGTNKTIHTVFELYHIKLGLEPDPKLFDVHANFTVYEAQAPKK